MSSIEKGSSASIELAITKPRTAVKVGGAALVLLSFQTLGIIYSDIGTSPLYVLNGIWPASGGTPSSEDVIGGVSVIIWSLTLLPLIKYCFVALYFGTREGEGGSFALYHGLFPPTERDFDADRTLTGDDGIASSIKTTRGPTISQSLKWPLLIWALFGTSLTMADGMLTPAVSVTSAVGGIAVPKPEVSDNIIPISIGILLALFLAQRFGTGRLSFLFSPVAAVWFLLLACTGIYNITMYPGIFRAFDPSRAVLLFVRTKNYNLLAGILLAVTGSEAVFANLGQFNALSIRLSFSCFVYPALVLAYLGQGAQLIVRGDEVISNVFYRTIPGPENGPLFWIVWLFAVLATVIASQAMITATFSLIQQIVNLKGLPPIHLSYTSETIQGQIYIPAINWALTIGTIAIVGAFKDLAQLTNAYGFAVATVMLSTTGLLAVQMRYVKHWPIVIPILFFIVFAFFDALFWGASIKKVPEGAWVPLMLGVIFTIIMVLWTWAKGLEDNFDRANRKNLRSFIIPENSEKEAHGVSTNNAQGKVYYVPYTGGERVAEGALVKKELSRIPTCAVFHKITEGKGVPHTFIGFIQQWPSLPRVVIFLSVCVVPINRVPLEDRYVVTKVRSIEGFYGVTYYIGFRDDFDVKVNDVIDHICALEMRANPEDAQRITTEIRAVSQIATHIAPHYHVVSKRIAWEGPFRILGTGINFVRRALIEEVYRRLATMFPETQNWLTPADEIIHVGINAVI